jgi:hypothetical protein
MAFIIFLGFFAARSGGIVREGREDSKNNKSVHDVGVRVKVFKHQPVPPEADSREKPYGLFGFATALVDVQLKREAKEQRK